ncbi:hypothetical protein CVS40_11275 [Lucilia cuprina]|nr:hypothetical protein CVS40_11275 [Lucilia cuprina]
MAPLVAHVQPNFLSERIASKMTRLGIACGLPWMLASCYGAGSWWCDDDDVVDWCWRYDDDGSWWWDGDGDEGSSDGSSLVYPGRCFLVELPMDVGWGEEGCGVVCHSTCTYLGYHSCTHCVVQWTPLPEIACRIAANGTGRKADIGAQLGPWVQDYERCK